MKWVSANGFFLPALICILLTSNALLADSDEHNSEKEDLDPVSDEKAKVRLEKSKNYCSVLSFRTTFKNLATSGLLQYSPRDTV